MTIQSIPQIANVLRNAMVFNINNWNYSMEDPGLLDQTIEKLFQILQQRKIDFVLVGGIALLHYVNGRNTQDLDLLMSVNALRKIPELKVTHQDLYFARATYDQVQIDILLTKNPLFKKVQQKYATIQQFWDIQIPIATVEGLILLKLYALPSLYRQGDFVRVSLYENDIAALIQAYQPRLDILQTELALSLDQNDMREINDILDDIQKRIRRFTDGL